MTVTQMERRRSQFRERATVWSTHAHETARRALVIFYSLSLVCCELDITEYNPVSEHWPKRRSSANAIPSWWLTFEGKRMQKVHCHILRRNSNIIRKDDGLQNNYCVTMRNVTSAFVDEVVSQQHLEFSFCANNGSGEGRIGVSPCRTRQLRRRSDVCPATSI